jgi:HPt (histidine-containing phosphotransfer) domain-containing protein
MTQGMQHESMNYDLTYLEELSSGDFLFVQSIIRQFVTEAPLAIEKISMAYKLKNWDELTYQIHKFAPNLAFVGINDIREETNNLELFSKKQVNLSMIPVLIEILKNRCEIAVNSLKMDFEL